MPAIELEAKGIKDLQGTINKLITALGGLEKHIVTLNASGNAIDRTFGSMDNLKSLVKTLNGLNEGGLKALRQLTSSIKALGKVMAEMPDQSSGSSFLTSIKDLVTALGTLSQKGVAVSLNVKAIAESIKTLTKALAEMSKENSGEDFSKTITSILEAFKDTNRIQSVADISGTLGQSILSLKDAFDHLSKLSVDVDKNKLKKITILVKGIADIFLSVGRTKLIGNDSLGVFNQFSGAVNRFGQGIRKIIKEIDTLPAIPIAKFFKIRVFAIVMRSIFEAIAQVGRQQVNNGSFEVIDNFSKIIDRLGRGLGGLSRIQDIGFKKAIALTKFLTTLALGFRVVNLAAGKLTNLHGFATVFEAIFSTLGRITEFNIGARGGAVQGNVIKTLRTLVKIIIPLVKTLGKAAKNFKEGNIDGISRALEAVGRFISSGLDFNGKKLRDFPDTVKSIVEGLDQFNKLNVDPQKLAAIGQALDAISRFQTSGGGGFFNFGKNLAGEIRKGILSAGLTTFFVRLFKSILTSPVVLVRALGTVFSDVFTRIRSVITNAISGLDQLGDKLRSIGQNLSSFGLSLNNNFGLGALTNSNFFQVAAEFDDLTNKLRVFGNLTDDQLGTATEFADQIGIKYPLSANEAITAMINLSKAGLELNDTMSALPAAADLAALSDTGSIENTSRLLIQVAGSFEQFTSEVEGSFDNINTAADLIARGANNSTASVESLQAGLANVGPIANAFGFTLEETVAILGLFEDAGIRGAEAGTQLKSLLTNITRDTPQTRQAFADLGVEVEGTNGQFKDANTLLNDLITALNTPRTFTRGLTNITDAQQHELELAQKALAAATRNTLIYQDGLSTAAVNAAEDEGRLQQRIQQNQQVQANAQEVITRITGSQAEAERITDQIARTEAENFRAIQALAGSFGQAGLNILVNEGEDAIKDFIDEMGRLPTAAEQAQLMLDSFKGDVDQLKGSFETLMKDVFLPMIQQFFRPLVQFGRTVADSLLQLPQPIKEIASNAIFLVATLSSLIGGFLVIIGTITQFGGVILSTVAAFAKLASFSGAILAGIAGLVASFVTLVTIGTLLVGIISAVSVVFTDFSNIIRNNVGGAADKLNTLRSGVELLIGSIKLFITEIGNVGHDLFSTLFTDDTSKRGEAVADTFVRINNAIGGFRQKIDQLRTVIITFRQFIQLQNDLIRVGQQFGDSDITGTGALSQAAIAKAAVVERLTQSLNRIAQFDIVKRLFGDDITGTKLKTIFGNIQAGLTELGLGIRQFISGSLGLLSGDEDAVRQVRAGFSKILKTAARVIESFTGIDLGAAIIQFSSSNVELGLKAFVGSIMDTIKTLLFSHEEEITNILTTLFNFLLPGSQSVPFIAKALGLDNIASIATDVFAKINAAFRSFIGVLFDIAGGQDLETAVIGNFGENARPVIRLVKALGKAVDFLVGIFKDLIGVLFPSGAASENNNIIATVLNGITDALNFLTTEILGPVKQGITVLRDFFGDVFTKFFALVQLGIPALNRIGAAFQKFFANLTSGKSNVGDLLRSIVAGLTDFSQLTGLGDLITGAAQGLAQLVMSAISQIPDFLIGVGNTIGSTFLTTLGEDLKTGNFSATIGNATSGFVTLIKAALAGVGAALTGLGELVGSPFLVNLGDALSKADLLSAAGVLVSGFVTGLKAIIALVPEGIKNLGTLLGDPLLTKFGEALQTGDFSAATGIMLGALVNLVSGVIGKIPKALTDLGTLLGSPFLIELGSSLQKGDFSSAIQIAAQGFLTLVQSSIKGVGALITGLAETIGSPFLDKLGEAFTNLDIPKAFSIVASGIWAAIQKAILLVGGLITNVGIDIGSPFLEALGTDLSTGNVGGAIQLVASGIWDAIKSAITIVPKLIIGLGELLGDPLLQQLGKELQTGDFSGSIGSISEGVKRIVSDAILGIPDLLGDQSLNTEVLQGLADGLSSIAALPLTLLKAAFDSIKSLTETLNSADPGKMERAKGVIVALLAGLAVVLLPVVGPIALVAFGIDVLVRAVQALADFVNTGDPISAINGFFSSLASDIFGLFGRDDMSPEKIGESVELFFDNIIAFVETGSRLLVRKLIEALAPIVTTVQQKLDEVQLLFDRVSPLAADQKVATLFDSIDNAFRAGSEHGKGAGERLDMLTIIADDILNSAQNGQISQSGLDLLARRFSESFSTQISPLINDIISEEDREFELPMIFVPSEELSEVDQERLRSIFSLLAVQTGATFTQAINDLPDDQTGAFIQKFFELSPEAAANVQWNTILSNLQIQALTAADAQQGLNIIDVLVANSELSPEAAAVFREQFQTLFDTLTPGQTGTTVDIPVVPNVTSTESGDDLATDVNQTLEGIVNDALADQPAKITVDALIEPNAIQDPADQEQVIANLTEINRQAGEAAIKLRDTAVAAGEYGVAIVTNSLLASTAWTLSSILILLNAQAIKNLVDQIGISYKGFVDSVILNVDPINTATLAVVDSIKFMYDQVQPQLQKLVDQVVALATGLGVLPGALNALGIGLNTGGGGGGPQSPSQLATGGPVFKGNLYEVAEKGMSELLSINGRTFLIPGANGTVIPASNPRMMMGNPTPSVSRNSSVSSNVVIQEGPINISIVPPAGTNEAQIANLTSAKLAQERQANQSDVQRRLRNAGRI